MKVSARPLCGLLLVIVAKSLACSYVELIVDKNTTVIGRTMELATRFASWSVEMYPRNATKTPLAPGYGFLSVDGTLSVGGSVLRIPVEGINEHGFTISTQTLRSSVYQSAESSLPTVGFSTVAARLLRQAATVDEAIALLRGWRVVAEVPIIQKLESGTHWALNDAMGHSVVVEYLAGQLTVSNNSVGVLTNDPQYSWHLQNLNTHASLQLGWPKVPASIQVPSSEGVIPRVIGHGFNLAGLPGDSSPPARFTRLFYLRQFAQATQGWSSIDEAVVATTGLINNVHLIKGTVARGSSLASYEYTPFAVIKIPSARDFLFRSYADMQWRRVRLSELDWTGSRLVSWVVDESELNIKDMTHNFQPKSE